MQDAINPMPELNEMINKLKLLSFKENLSNRNRVAIDKKLTYPEFLGLMLQDEIMRREEIKFSSRMKKANFKFNKTIENFDFDFNPKINKRLITELTRCHFVEEKVCVLIIGPCGTGKSHLAQALGFCTVKKGKDVLFYSQNKLLQELQSAKATNSYDKKINSLAKVPLLIIDDFGLKPLRSPDDENFHALINERYENTSTIITSNLAFSEWIEPFQNKLLGTACIDRLRHGAYTIVIEGGSYRAVKKNNGKNVEVCDKKLIN